MMMKSKIGLFCCDIFNTYYYKLENHNEERKKFINNLIRIMEKDNLNGLFFSFITSDNDEFLDYFIEDIKYHLPDNIKLIEQFFYNGYLFNKEKKNFNYLNKNDVIDYLIKKYNPVKTYYADDLISNHNNKDIIHFIPGEDSKNKGLNGLNEIVEKYLKTS